MTVRRQTRLGFALFLAGLTAWPLYADNWLRFRGPGGQGVSTESGLPLHWSSTENVRWRSEIPGEGHSSPVVLGDRVFVTSAMNDGTRRVVHALRRTDGQILWSRETPDLNPERTSSATGHSAATPVLRRGRVVAAFGNAGVVCYDFGGNLVWHHEVEPFETELGLASSPIIWRDLVILVCDHDGEPPRSFHSYLLALDLATGAVRWKTERPGVFRSWSTPIVVAGDEQPQLIVCAQEQVRAYHPADGHELWRVSGLSGWVAPSPVFAHGLVFAASGKNGPILAVRPGGSGDVTASHIAWQTRTGGPYVCSPVIAGDFLYILTENGFLACLDARTGTTNYRERLEGKFTASPVAADGKVYCTNEAGTTFVVKAGPLFEVLAKNVLGEPTFASPAAAHGDLLLRTDKHLYCIGSAPSR